MRHGRASAKYPESSERTTRAGGPPMTETSTSAIGSSLVGSAALVTIAPRTEMGFFARKSASRRIDTPNPTPAPHSAKVFLLLTALSYDATRRKRPAQGIFYHAHFRLSFGLGDLQYGRGARATSSIRPCSLCGQPGDGKSGEPADSFAAQSAAADGCAGWHWSPFPGTRRPAGHTVFQ